MTTLYKISEQIQRLYAKQFADKENLKPKLHPEEIRLVVNQVTNELLDMKPKVGMRVGTTSIPSCMIATYPSIDVANNGGVYTSVLPAHPLQLPFDIGVWHISSVSGGTPLIPLPSAYSDLLHGLDEKLLENQVGFTVEGRTVTYTGDPSGPVKIKLLVVDVGLLEPNDPYPIPPELESTLIERSLQLLTRVPMAPDQPKG